MRYVVNGLAVKRMLVGITYLSTKMTLVNMVIQCIAIFIYGRLHKNSKMLQQKSVKCDVCNREIPQDFSDVVKFGGHDAYMHLIKEQEN